MIGLNTFGPMTDIGGKREKTKAKSHDSLSYRFHPKRGRQYHQKEEQATKQEGWLNQEKPAGYTIFSDQKNLAE